MSDNEPKKEIWKWYKKTDKERIGEKKLVQTFYIPAKDNTFKHDAIRACSIKANMSIAALINKLFMEHFIKEGVFNTNGTPNEQKLIELIDLIERPK